MTATRKIRPVNWTPSLKRESMLEIQEEAIALLQPENELEQLLLAQPEFLEGLNWGFPRYGHPEGKVLFHVREVLDNIDRIQTLSATTRKRLRSITFVHDTFKYSEDKNRPRDWTRHHSILARDFLNRFMKDKPTLDVIELHDEAFYAWRNIHLADQEERGTARFQQLLDRLSDNLQLYYLFFKCDTRTGDKIQAPLKWFEEYVQGIDLVDF